MKNNKNIYFLILIFAFTLLGILNVKANNLIVPEITSFTPSTVEKNALLLKFKSSNTGTNYSYELVNTVNNKQNNLSGSVTSFTLQNLNSNTTYGVIMRACSNNTYSCSNWTSIKTATTPKNTSDNNPNTPTITTNIVSYTFNDVGKSITITAKASNGKKVTYSSSNSNVASVNQNGVVKSKKPGTAIITASLGSTKKSITVTVPSIGTRANALKPWHDIMVDTYKYIYDRPYHRENGKYWTTNGKWNGKTGKTGNTQSCITLPTTSLKRIGLMAKTKGNFWYNSKTSKNGSGKHEANDKVKYIQKHSPYMKITYPHKSYKSLIKSGSIVYGDIVCNNGHTWIYMGQNKNDMRVFESGTERGIGGGAYVKWGYVNLSKAKPKSATVKKQIEATKKALKSHPVSYFNGANIQNKDSKIYIVGHIKDFTIKTSATNGTITHSNRYMASRDYTIKYTPKTGYKLSSITVDGKAVSANTYKSSYKFNNLKANHTIHVKFIKK